MQHPRQWTAFRLSDTLQIQLYRMTDTFPAEADAELITGLRFAAAAVSRHVLRGCNTRRYAAEQAFRAAMTELDGVGDLVEAAERLGYLSPPEVLELLETQTALLMQCILITQGAEAAPPEHPMQALPEAA